MAFGLPAGFAQLQLVVGQEFLGFVTQPLGILNRLVDVVLPRLLQTHERIEGELVEQPHQTQEGDQRTR